MPKVFNKVIFFFLALLPFINLILIIVSTFRNGDFDLLHSITTASLVLTKETNRFHLVYTDDSVIGLFLSVFFVQDGYINKTNVTYFLFDILYNLDTVGFPLRFTFVPFIILMYESFVYFIKMLVDLVTLIPRKISEMVGDKV